MFKALLFLLSPLAAVSLVFALGWPVLVLCFGLALGALLFSSQSIDVLAKNDRDPDYYETTYLAGL